MVASWGRQGSDPGEFNLTRIDDNPGNVVGARAVGMRAIHFESPEQARRELTEMGAL